MGDALIGGERHRIMASDAFGDGWPQGDAVEGVAGRQDGQRSERRHAIQGVHQGVMVGGIQKGQHQQEVSEKHENGRQAQGHSVPRRFEHDETKAGHQEEGKQIRETVAGQLTLSHSLLCSSKSEIPHRGAGQFVIVWEPLLPHHAVRNVDKG